MTTATFSRIGMTINAIGQQLARALTGRHGTAPAIESDLREVETLVDKHLATVAALDSNDTFTLKGKNEGRMKSAREAYAAVVAWGGRRVEVMDERIAGVRREIERKLDAASSSADPTDRIVREMRKAEIRAQLRDVDPIELAAIFQELSPLAREAVLEAPARVRPGVVGQSLATVVPWVNPATVNAVTIARIRAENPEGAAQLEDFEAIRDAYASVVATAIDEIRNSVGGAHLGPDPIAQAAAAGGAK